MPKARIRESEEGTPACRWAYFTYPARHTTASETKPNLSTIDTSLLIFRCSFDQSKEQRANAALAERRHDLCDSRRAMVECNKVADHYGTTSCLCVSSFAYLRKAW